MIDRDSFFSTLQSLPQFVLETDANFDEALNWVLDQCQWCTLSNAEFRMVEEVFEEAIAWVLYTLCQKY